MDVSEVKGEQAEGEVTGHEIASGQTLETSYIPHSLQSADQTSGQVAERLPGQEEGQGKEPPGKKTETFTSLDFSKSFSER